MADIWVPLRAGTDILFLGGLIHYALENDKYFREYVAALHQRAHDHQGGVPRYRRSGRSLLRMGRAEEEVRSGDPGSTRARTRKMPAGPAARPLSHAEGGHGKDRGGEAADLNKRIRGRSNTAAPSLRLPDSAQAFRALHARTDRTARRRAAEAVSESCGSLLQRARVRTKPAPSATPWDGRSIPKAYRSSARRRSCSCCWATSAVPAAAFSPCADTRPFRVPPIFPHCMTFFPATCRCRSSSRTPTISRATSRSTQPTAGLWSNFDNYFVSLMKSWYGDNATTENNWCFDYMPRVTGDHSHFGYWLDMQDGKMEGLFIMGQNPAVGASNARLQRTAMSKLKWLVVRDMVEMESASWWYNSPEVERGELKPEEIATEVFLVSRSRFGGERRLPDQHPAAGAVPYQSRRSSGRRAQRDLVYASSGAASEGKSRGRSESAQCAAERACTGPMARTAFTTSPTSTRS